MFLIKKSEYGWIEQIKAHKIEIYTEDIVDPLLPELPNEQIENRSIAIAASTKKYILFSFFILKNLILLKKTDHIFVIILHDDSQRL